MMKKDIIYISCVEDFHTHSGDIKHIITTGDIVDVLSDLREYNDYGLFLYDSDNKYHFIDLAEYKVQSSNTLHELTYKLDSFYFIPTEVIQEYLDSFKEVKGSDVNLEDYLKLHLKDFIDENEYFDKSINNIIGDYILKDYLKKK